MLASAPGAVFAQTAFAQTTPYPLNALSADQERDLDCIAQAIVYEAGHEPIEGQQAVAQVILNRMQSVHFPKTACGVVYQGSSRRTGCQFTFTCDGSLSRPMPERLFIAARAVALSALTGTLPDRVGGATHYHADYVSPYWAPSLVRVSQIGAHIFYRPEAGGAGPGARPVAVQLAAIDRPALVGQQLAPARPFSPWGLPLQ